MNASDGLKAPVFDIAIFDFDGTVADTLPLIYGAFDAALAEPLGRRLGDREIRALFGPPDQDILRTVLPADRVTAAHERYLAYYEREHGRLVTIFNGMHNLLQRCRAAGMSLGLVTGKSRRTALLSLEKLEIADLFDVIVAGDDVTLPKPHAEGALAALAALGHEPGQRGVFIGDSAADVVAGRDAGLTTIAVRWGDPDFDELLAAKPDVLCQTVGELASALGLDELSSSG
jgi:HAD superfamily hydrolase (TIGR01509 family)